MRGDGFRAANLTVALATLKLSVALIPGDFRVIGTGELEAPVPKRSHAQEVPLQLCNSMVVGAVK